MKRILIITYYFPPAGGGGVQRVTKFIKYLPRYEWEPIVATTTPDAYIECDVCLKNDIPDTVIVEKVRSLLTKKQTSKIKNQYNTEFPWENNKKKTILSNIISFFRNLFLIPDSQILWVLPLAFKLKKIIVKHQPDIIFATAPPYSVLIAGYIAKILSGLPLIIDYRDPWTQFFSTFRKYESDFRKEIELYMEKRILNKADKIILTSKSLLAAFKNELSKKNYNKCRIVYNGYDEDDFKNVRPHTFNKFTIVYTGKVTPNEYSAELFIKSFGLLMQNRPDLKNKIEVIFVGSFRDEKAIHTMDQFKINNNIKLLGYKNHRFTVSYQLGADALLLLLQPGYTDSFVIFGKLFEYIRTGKPILSLLPSGCEMTEILNKIDGSIIDSTYNTINISKKIESIYSLGRQKKYVRPQKEIFSRENQTKKMAGYLDSFLQEGTYYI